MLSAPMRIYRDKYQSATGYTDAASSPLVILRITRVPTEPSLRRFGQGRIDGGNKLR